MNSQEMTTVPEGENALQPYLLKYRVATLAGLHGVRIRVHPVDSDVICAESLYDKKSVTQAEKQGTLLLLDILWQDEH